MLCGGNVSAEKQQPMAVKRRKKLKRPVLDGCDEQQGEEQQTTPAKKPKKVTVEVEILDAVRQLSAKGDNAFDIGNIRNPHVNTYWGNHRNIIEDDSTLSKEALFYRVAQCLVDTVFYVDKTQMVYKKIEDTMGLYPRFEPIPESKFLSAIAKVQVSIGKGRHARLVDAYHAIREDYLWYRDVIFWPSIRQTEADCSKAYHHAGHHSQRVFNIFTCFAAQKDVEPLLIDKVPWSPDTFEMDVLRLYQYHMYTVLCNSDIRKYSFMHAWHVFTIQYPYLKTEIILIIFGAHGAGKSVWSEFFLNYVLGRSHGEIVYRQDDVDGRFTGNVMTHVLAVMEDHRKKIGKESGTLKNLATSVYRDEEIKFMQKCLVLNFLKLQVISNLKYAVYIEETERRYAAFEVGDKHVADVPYHTTMTRYFRDHEGAKRTARTIYRHMRTIPCTFQVGERFDTPELLEIKRHSALQFDNIVGWLKTAETMHPRLFLAAKEKPRGLWVRELYKSYAEFAECSRKYKLTMTEFETRWSEMTKKAGIGSVQVHKLDQEMGTKVNNNGYKLSLEDVQHIIRNNSADRKFEFQGQLIDCTVE